MASQKRMPSDSTVDSSGVDCMDIDESKPSNPASRSSSLTAPSINETPLVFNSHEERMTYLQSRIHNLRLEAQRAVNLQPKSTQLSLTKATRDIFTPYRTHGSETRLSQSIKQYFDARYPANDRIWSPDEARDRAAGAAATMAQLRLLAANQALQNANDAAQHEGLWPPDPATVPGADINDSPLDGRRTQVNDEESTEYIRSLDFSPANITLQLPADVNVPKELVSTVNRILAVLNVQANVKLNHFVDKYITLHHSPLKTQHGYAILRLGVSEEFSERVSNLFDTARTNGLGLTERQRTWLREVWMHRGLNGKGLTRREKTILAGAAGITVEVLDEWWEGMVRQCRGWIASRIWVAARELETTRKAKLEGRY
jgi:hypothetical protein